MHADRMKQADFGQNLQALLGLLHQRCSLAPQRVNAHVVVHLLSEVGSPRDSFGVGCEDLAVQGMQARQVDSCIGCVVAEAGHRAGPPVRVAQQQPL